MMHNVLSPSSHDQTPWITPFIHEFFTRLANKNLTKMSMDVASELSHLKQVKRRIENGEDLSNELPQLKLRSQQSAIGVINKLISECDSQLVSCWALHKATKAQLRFSHETHKGELVPHFKVQYAFKTKLGVVRIQLRTQGRYVFISNQSEGISIAKMDLALREVEQYLTMGGLAI